MGRGKEKSALTSGRGQSAAAEAAQPHCAYSLLRFGELVKRGKDER